MEHENRDAEERAVGEESEDEGGGNLIRSVGYAYIEVGQVGFHEVAN